MITKVEGRWINTEQALHQDWAELDKEFMPEVYDENTLTDAMLEDQTALTQFDDKISYEYKVTRTNGETIYNVRNV